MSENRSILQPTGLVHGHCECRYLEESVPVLCSVLALDELERDGDAAILKHPNTGWKLIVHQGGAEVQDKPERNHYGVRVSNNQEVDNAYQYLLANKDNLGLKKVVKRKERDGSYSMFFVDPGGNYWEIESYQHRHEAGLPYEVAYPWAKPLTEKEFSGRGYVPQAFTHGTIECADWESSVKFYTEGLGMEMITHVTTPKPHNIKHSSQPWYVVSLEVPERSRKYLGPLQRFTIAVESPAKLGAAREALEARRQEFGIHDITAIEKNAAAESFMLCDLNRNWWEIEYARQ